MKIAFLMDPLETVKAYKDTSYYLMLAANQLGHEVFYFNQSSMQAGNGTVRANISRLEVHASIKQPFTVLETADIDLSSMDVIFVRTDPPFDRSYFYSTLLLDLVGARTLVVNRPSGIRNWNEKLAALLYPEYTPKTLITNQADEIFDLVKQCDRITVKPIDGHGGKGIFFLENDNQHGRQQVTRITHGGNHWVIAQEYLPDAVNGDKRILLVDGDPIGAVLRVHAEGQELNNLDQGAEAVCSELDARDLEICKEMKPGLLQEGIFFCGIDVIGGMLIEVNVTSPTCLQELCKFSSVAHHHSIIQLLERKITSHLSSQII